MYFWQLSKCILAWWSLKCIKWYESYNRQQFGLEAGPRAPMGEGVYLFNTRGDQDNQIFDRLDNYIMEAAGLRQVSACGFQNKPVNTQHGHIVEHSL